MAYPTIESFIDDIRWALGNRSDIDARISGWAKEAYREIAMGFPLETLEEPYSSITVPGIAEYDYPDDARGFKSLTVLVGNQPVPVVKKNIEVIERYQTISRGVPSIWAGFSTQFVVRPVPNLSYPMRGRYWQKPQIAADESDVDVINSTEVQLPDDWFEVFKQATIQKGHAALEEYDKAGAVRQLLNGDPNSSKGFPGMIKERLTRDASENVMANYGLRPRVRRYTRGR